MTVKYTYVKRHSRSIGRSCMHCGRPATVTATRNNGYKLEVRYCDEHAELRGLVASGGK